MRTAAVVLALAMAAPAWAQAQGAAPRSTAQRRVDPLTASIQGRVTAADSGAPVRRAEVRAVAENGATRLATTDTEGRFVLRDLPASQFRLHVSKSGFVSVGYGQRRPFEAPAAITLAEGQQFAANFALPRGGAIAGRVIDEAGEPLANVRVQALRPRMQEGVRRLLPSGPVDISDDTGAFRLYGLAPGEYLVSAAPPRRDTPLPMGMPLVAPALPRAPTTPSITYHPGTPSFQEALRVAVPAGGEVRADIQIGSVRAASVSGVVLTSNGSPASDATITLSSDVVAMGFSALNPGAPPLMVSGHAAPDGTFTLPAVPPGPYSLRASTQEVSRAALMPTEMVAIPLVVTGSDMSGLTLVTAPPVTVEGGFVADAGVTRPLPARLGVSASAVHGGLSRMNMSGSGTFRIAGMNGPMHLQVTGLPEEWAVKSVLVNGVETVDKPFDPRGMQNADVRIVLTDRITEMIGRVDDGAPAGGDGGRQYDVVVFADDATKWTYPSRYVRTVRTDENGTFRMTALPGNERYLAVAVDYLEEGEGGDPEFLERIRNQATPFILGDAERRAVDLRLVRR
jgi:hypothetical protein